MSTFKAAREGIDEALSWLYNEYCDKYEEDVRELEDLDRFTPARGHIEALEQGLEEVFRLARDGAQLTREPREVHDRIQALRDLMLRGEGTGLPE